jgi:hypothetical protein
MPIDPFVGRLLALSDEHIDFERARREWSLRALLDGVPSSCLCGRPVRDEVCVIEHRRTRQCARIGACCAEKHMRMPAKRIFASWSRVSAHPAKPFNVDFVDFAFRTGLLTVWERDFYRDTWRMRALSLEQERKRKQINRKVVSKMRSTISLAFCL